MRTSLLILSALTIAACSVFSGPPDPRWADYRNWTEVARGLTGDPDEVLDGAHNAARGYRNVWVNDVGKQTLLGDGPYVYPVGTVIVKEQFPDEASWRADRTPELTVMLKIAEGEGDQTWHWAIGRSGAGPMRMCADCHEAVAEEDYVFTNGSVLDNGQ